MNAVSYNRVRHPLDSQHIFVQICSCTVPFFWQVVFVAVLSPPCIPGLYSFLQSVILIASFCIKRYVLIECFFLLLRFQCFNSLLNVLVSLDDEWQVVLPRRKRSTSSSSEVVVQRNSVSSTPSPQQRAEVVEVSFVLFCGVSF